MPKETNAAAQTRRPGRESRRLRDLRPPILTLGYLCPGPAASAPFPCGCRLSSWQLNSNLLFASCETGSGEADSKIEGWSNRCRRKRGCRSWHSGVVGCFDVGSFCDVAGCRSAGSNGGISSEATSDGEASTKPALQVWLAVSTSVASAMSQGVDQLAAAPTAASLPKRRATERQARMNIFCMRCIEGEKNLL